MDSRLVLLCPDGTSNLISQFRENFSLSEDLVDFTPPYISLFETFVASKDINKGLNRYMVRASLSPITLYFDEISYRHVHEDIWSVVYKMSDDSEFRSLWNRVRNCSSGSVIEANSVCDPYLHISNCTYDDIIPLQECATKELGCLSFEVNEIAGVWLNSPLTIGRNIESFSYVSRKFVQSNMVVNEPTPITPMDSVKIIAEEAAEFAIREQISFCNHEASEKKSVFTLESQVSHQSESSWDDFEEYRVGSLIKDTVWTPALGSFGTLGYYVTKRSMQLRTAKGLRTLPRNTIVLVQKIGHREAEITVPQAGWIPFTKQVLQPLCKPEMRPGSYETQCDLSVATGRCKEVQIPKGCNVTVHFTRQVQKRTTDSLTGKKISINSGKMLDSVNISCSLNGRRVKGFIKLFDEDNNLVLKYKCFAFENRAFQNVKEAKKNLVVKTSSLLNKQDPLSFLDFTKKGPSSKPDYPESVVSEAFSCTSGVSSRSSGSMSHRVPIQTGSKFGQPGVYLMFHDHGVHATKDFTKKEFVQVEKFNKKRNCVESRDAIIRRNQPVSVWKVVGDRAQIVAPFEGWIKFGKAFASLKTYDAKQGDLFEVRARGGATVYGSNNFDASEVCELHRGTKVQVTRFEGASALISKPVVGWVDIVGSALTKKLRPRLVLSEIPYNLVKDPTQGAKKVVCILENAGIPCSRFDDGKTRSIVKVFVNKRRWVYKDVVVGPKQGNLMKKEKFLKTKLKKTKTLSETVSATLIFDSEYDAKYALDQTIRLPTHILPLNWSKSDQLLRA